MVAGLPWYDLLKFMAYRPWSQGTAPVLLFIESTRQSIRPFPFLCDKHHRGEHQFTLLHIVSRSKLHSYPIFEHPPPVDCFHYNPHHSGTRFLTFFNTFTQLFLLPKYYLFCRSCLLTLNKSCRTRLHNSGQEIQKHSRWGSSLISSTNDMIVVKLPTLWYVDSAGCSSVKVWWDERKLPFFY